MKISKFVGIAAVVLAGAASVLSTQAVAQSWPTRPVRIIVPFGAGGGTDIQGRLLGKKFYESMGQTFIVDNRPGASGLIGAELATKSPPDGYTILFTTASLSVNVTLYASRIKFDPFKDLEPVSWISSVPLVLCRSSERAGEDGAGTDRPGEEGQPQSGQQRRRHDQPSRRWRCSTSSPSSSCRSFRTRAAARPLTAALSGEVDFVFGTALSVAPYVSQGKVSALWR